MLRTLTKVEEQIMQLVWKLGQGFLKDIMELCPEPKPHPNTIATILKILIEKDFVEYEVQGRNNVYRAKVNKEHYAQNSIHQLVKGYFEGSAAKLVSHFVAENKLTTKELDELLEQIKSSKNRSK